MAHAKKKLILHPAKDHKDARSRIFEAAVKEFAIHGPAGARTDAIAKAADVNIALLFYYFKSKEELYCTILEEMFSRWASTLTAPLQGRGTPREKITAYVEAFFDYIAAKVWHPRLVQQELMRTKHSPAIRKLFKKYVKPVYAEVINILREGIAGGSFRPELDVDNFIYTISGIVSQYFNNSSALHEISGIDPLTPERIRARRAAVLDVVLAALLSKEELYPNVDTQRKRNAK